MPRITIRNDQPRRDINGDIIDAHDGCLHFFEGRYWLYGTEYGDSNGYQKTHRYVVYSSPDLQSWTPHGNVLPNLEPALYVRPYVAYNADTRKYVLWYNWYHEWRGTTNWAAGDGPTPGYIGVATSDTPEGPFTVVNPRVHLAQQDGVHVGDLSLFVDHDRTAYLVYAAIASPHKMIVERLGPDYCSSTLQTSEILGRSVEAPAMIRRGDFYYVMFGRCCCFCPEGSGAMVFRSRSPLGPYAYRNNVNRTNPAPGLPDDAHAGDAIVRAQLNYIAQIETTDGPALIWMGDRWESTPDGRKGHDFQVWLPLQFDANGDLLPLEPKAAFELSLL